jgi:hypothetical protein
MFAVNGFPDADLLQISLKIKLPADANNDLCQVELPDSSIATIFFNIG